MGEKLLYTPNVQSDQNDVITNSTKLNSECSWKHANSELKTAKCGSMWEDNCKIYSTISIWYRKRMQQSETKFQVKAARKTG